MIVIPAPLRSDFIHMAGMTIHIALESTIHIVGIRNQRATLKLIARFSVAPQHSSSLQVLAF